MKKMSFSTYQKSCIISAQIEHLRESKTMTTNDPHTFSNTIPLNHFVSVYQSRNLKKLGENIVCYQNL